MNVTIPELREYYGKKYRAIINALDEINATDISVDTLCGKYLEVACRIHNDHAIYGHRGARFNINIGLNNKYNTWFNRDVGYTATARHSFNTQAEAARYILIKGGKAQLASYGRDFDLYHDGYKC